VLTIVAVIMLNAQLQVENSYMFLPTDWGANGQSCFIIHVSDQDRAADEKYFQRGPVICRFPEYYDPNAVVHLVPDGIPPTTLT
jgi:hypothetical protein